MLLTLIRLIMRRPRKVDNVLSQFNRQIEHLEGIHAHHKAEIVRQDEKIALAARKKNESHTEGSRAMAVADKIRVLIG